MGVGQKIPKGYKQTDVGVIPEDWSESIIGDSINFVGGSQPPRETFIFSPREGYIRLIQIRDYKTEKYHTFIPKNLARRFCSSEDIMIGRYGPPVFQILRGINGAYNVALIKAVPNENIEIEFAYHLLKQKKLFDFIENLSQRSSGQTGVDLLQLRKYPLFLPPLPEQKAIAKVLSDTDSLIESLDALIDKKKAIKQGAMQELLTGKRRLPGFAKSSEYKQTEVGVIPEDWEVNSIGELSEKIIGGGTPSRSNNEFWNGPIPWMSVKDLSSMSTISTKESITKKGLQNSASNLIKRGTLICSTRMAVGKPIIYKIDVAINQDMKAIFWSRYVDTTFSFYVFTRLEKEISQVSGGSTVKGLALPDLKKIQIGIPSLPEQKAIAKILSDMDSEIEALEQKRDKYKQIKQGMMEQLLTGKVRLV
jgi:type I restriction enzyme S subunit